MSTEKDDAAHVIPNSLATNMRRGFLHFKAVKASAFGPDGKLLAAGSGFIYKDAGVTWLYTAWHLVTGYDMHALDLKVLKGRTRIDVELQDVKIEGSGRLLGNSRTLSIELFDQDGQPLWEQERTHVPNLDLNPHGIFVPLFSDAVRIQLPDVPLDDFQLSQTMLPIPQQDIGDQVLVVGYPYGFSVHGPGQPSGVVLTRFIAGRFPAGRLGELLLDGGGARSMSGGPVFGLTAAQRPFLCGMYTGLIYPDHTQPTREPSTALGVMCDLRHHLNGHARFTRTPDEVYE